MPLESRPHCVALGSKRSEEEEFRQSGLCFALCLPQGCVQGAEVQRRDAWQQPRIKEGGPVIAAQAAGQSFGCGAFCVPV